MRGFAEQSAGREGEGWGGKALSVYVPGETTSLSQEGYGRYTGSAWALTIVFVDDLPRRASSTR